MNTGGVELTWEGKRAPDFPPACPQEFALREFYGAGDAENRLYAGENLAVLGSLAGEYTGRVDCVYIDPPYNSQADYFADIPLHGSSGERWRQKQYGDCWRDCEYLQFMFERLVALRELLAETGSIFVHCDWHAAAALRLVCDEVFGARNLLNEIVWVYGSGGGSKRRFGRKHDTILFYAKRAGRHFFDPDVVRVPYRAAIAPKRRGLFHPEGKVAPDVWEISRPPNHAASWVGYPTQKPLAVMERALRAACPPGGLVLDCFAGSGSTLVVAAGLGLRFIGVEKSALGVHLTRKRLVSLGAVFGVWRMFDSRLMNPGDKHQLGYPSDCSGETNPPNQNPAAMPPERVAALNGAKVWALSDCRDAVLAAAANNGLEVSDWRELVDWVATDLAWVATDPTGGGQIFAPTRFDIPARQDLIQDIPATGVSLVTTITGRDYYVMDT